MEAKATAKAEKKPKAKHGEPTARTARAMWDDDVDERLVSDTEIKGWWNKSLLSGARGGSVSFAQKAQKDKNSAARAHKVTMVLCDEANGMVKSALTGSDRTFSALEEEELLEAAFVWTEVKDQKRTDRFLEVTDAAFAQHYLLEDDLHLSELALEETYSADSI